MKVVIWMSLAFAALSWADEVVDRAAIERGVRTLNADKAGAGQERIAGLFAADAENELGRLSDLDRRLLQASNKPFSEVTRPRIVIQSVRFITPEVALVDAANTQYGSTMMVRRVPVLMVMKKEGKDWRIASLRVMVDLMSMP